MSHGSTAPWIEHEDVAAHESDAAAVRFARLRQRVQSRRAAFQLAAAKAKAGFAPRSISRSPVQPRSAFADFCTAWTENEQAIVRFVMHGSRSRIAATLTTFVNRLGNGWLYVGVLAGLLILDANRTIRPALAAGISIALAFCCYAWIKPRLARLRPCDADPQANSGIAPLDKYSFPSGHSMTASAAAVPLLFAFPAAQPAIVAAGLVIAWSRLACGHHYLTDVIAGAVLGAIIALPICALML
jgi:undecaprenyl-diphosphatase